MAHPDTPSHTSAVSDHAAAELTQVEHAFNQAMVSNDAEKIRACIADEWVLVTPEVGPVPAARILRVIATGQLRHDTMTKDVRRATVYGEVAVVTARGRNTGEFRGQPLSADEWVTDVYRRTEDGRWLCVLTHLTPAAAGSAASGEHQS